MVLQYSVGELGAEILGRRTGCCNTGWNNWVLQYRVGKLGAAIQGGNLQRQIVKL